MDEEDLLHQNQKRENSNSTDFNRDAFGLSVVEEEEEEDLLNIYDAPEPESLYSTLVNENYTLRFYPAANPFPKAAIAFTAISIPPGFEPRLPDSSQRGDDGGSFLLPRQVAAKALAEKSFSLFKGDFDKQQRFRRYLVHCTDPEKYPDAPSQDELIQFYQAARLFQPMHQILTERFAAESAELPQNTAAGDKSSEAKRETFNWTPCFLLCQVLGIQPKPEAPDVLASNQQRELLGDSEMKNLKSQLNLSVENGPERASADTLKQIFTPGSGVLPLPNLPKKRPRASDFW